MFDDTLQLDWALRAKMQGMEASSHSHKTNVRCMAIVVRFLERTESKRRQSPKCSANG